MKANWKKRSHPIVGEYHTWGDCKALVALENGLWHVSVSLQYRYPTWEEIKSAWYDLVPEAENRYGAIILPPKSAYVNLHSNCFHVHELAKEEVQHAVVNPNFFQKGGRSELPEREHFESCRA